MNLHREADLHMKVGAIHGKHIFRQRSQMFMQDTIHQDVQRTCIRQFILQG